MAAPSTHDTRANVRADASILPLTARLTSCVALARHAARQGRPGGLVLFASIGGRWWLSQVGARGAAATRAERAPARLVCILASIVRQRAGASCCATSWGAAAAVQTAAAARDAPLHACAQSRRALLGWAEIRAHITRGSAPTHGHRVLAHARDAFGCTRPAGDRCLCVAVA